MRRQRNVTQMKKQIKTPEKELNKMKISYLSHGDFKTLVIKMLKELSSLMLKDAQHHKKDSVRNEGYTN